MTVLICFLVLILTGVVYQRMASRRDNARFPAPGVLVASRYGKLHLRIIGQGRFTVVFESGQGDSSLEWHEIADAVSDFARVCVYDRPGLGWSAPANKPLSAEQMAENLYSALHAANVEGPYILVGHSIGGVYVRAFAQRYADEIAGLVLVDSAHENQQVKLPAAATREDAAVKWLALMLRMIAPVGLHRLLKLADRLQGDSFTDNVRPAAMARMNQTHFFKALYNEVNSAQISTRQSAPPQALGSLPLTVLSRGNVNPGMPDNLFQQLSASWDALQQDLMNLSSNSQRIIAKKSGHYIHHDQPELVVESIRLLVENGHGKAGVSGAVSEKSL